MYHDLAVAHLVVLGQLAVHANAIEINRFAPLLAAVTGSQTAQSCWQVLRGLGRSTLDRHRGCADTGPSTFPISEGGHPAAGQRSRQRQSGR
jgi:hypothetical protein